VIAYWILMTPESSVLPLYHPRVDYRPYPSSAFLFGALAMAAVTWLPRAVFVAGSVMAIGALTIASIQINRTWRTEETLWTHSVELGGDTVAYQSLAASIQDRRDPRIMAYLDRALAMAPRNVLAHVNYGLHLIELGRKDEGVVQVRQGVALAPKLAQPHYWLAVAYEAVEKPGPAAEEALAAAALEPGNMEYAYEAARLAQNGGMVAESIAPLRAVLARNERFKEAKFFEGFALQKTGEIDEAIGAYRRFLTWQPDHSQARFNLAHALMTKGDCAAAIPEFTRVLALKPDYREVHLYLSACYERAGDRTRAAAERRLLEGKD
jgi:predicted Zn-dependent protease